MSKFSVGDRVAFSRAVVKRLGYDKPTADARGRVVEIDGRVVGVDFGRTFVRADGETVRFVPAANLTKILANGVIYD
jgi:ribosomal protein S3